MREKLKHMTYAELPHTYDAYQHLLANFSDFYDEASEVFAGLGNGKRSDVVQASLFDAIHAEILGEHNVEKAKVRNRRKADRKHKLTPKMRKEQELMRKDRMYGYAWNLDCPKVRFVPDSEPIKTRKYAEGDRISREDWDAEIEEIIEDLDWAFFDMEYLNEQIGMLERNLHVGDNYVRFNRLCERRNVVAEVIRKNRFVEEMVKGECY